MFEKFRLFLPLVLLSVLQLTSRIKYLHTNEPHCYIDKFYPRQNFNIFRDNDIPRITRIQYIVFPFSAVIINSIGHTLTKHITYCLGNNSYNYSNFKNSIGRYSIIAQLA